MTLLRIGGALGVGLPALVGSPRPKPLKITRRGEGAALRNGECGGRGWLDGRDRPAGCGGAPGLGPGTWDRHVSEARPQGTKELLQVEQGTLTVELAGESFFLDACDAITFTGGVARSYANPGREPARFSLAIFEPGCGIRTLAGGGRCADLETLQGFLNGAGAKRSCQ